MSAPPPSRRLPALGVVLIVCAAAFFWQLGAPGIFDLDEGLYVAAAREMLLRSDFVTPVVRGEPFFEKPPLTYWCAAATMALFGRSEWAARLPAACAATLLVVFATLFGRRLFGERAGLYGGLILALTPLGLGAARMLTTDALLCLSIGISHYAAWRCLESEARVSFGWASVLWISMGVGLLAKGVPALVFPLATTLVYLLWTHRGGCAKLWSDLRKLQPAAGMALCVLLAGPWHYLAHAANGEAFWAEYVVRQHLMRFRGGDTSHLAPFWFYVPVFLLGFFPWSAFVVQSVRGAGVPSTSHAPRRFLLVWAAMVFAAFSASGSKLVSYILPMMPPMAMLVGAWLAEAELEPRRTRSIARTLTVVVVISGLLAVTVALLPRILQMAASRTGRAMDTADIAAEALVAGGWMLAVLAAGAAGGAWMAWNGRGAAAVGFLVAAMLGFTIIAGGRLVPALDAAYLRPLHSLAREAGRRVEQEGSLLINAGPPRRPSVLFYLPDRLLRPAHRRDLVESADEQAVHRFLRTTPTGLVLTTAQRGHALRQWDRRLEIEERMGWALVRPLPSSQDGAP